MGIEEGQGALAIAGVAGCSSFIYFLVAIVIVIAEAVCFFFWCRGRKHM